MIKSRSDSNSEQRGGEGRGGSASCNIKATETKSSGTVTTLSIETKAGENNEANHNSPSTTRKYTGSGDTTGTSGGRKDNDHQGMSKRKQGRHGDPRMNKALSTKMANPGMSLLQALLIGGFTFNRKTDRHSTAGGDGTIYDSDNITLRQRKNQLCRRLRVQKHVDEIQGTAVSPHSSLVQEGHEAYRGDDHSSSGVAAAIKKSVSRSQPIKKRSHDECLFDKETVSGNYSLSPSPEDLQFTTKKRKNNDALSSSSSILHLQSQSSFLPPVAGRQEIASQASLSDTAAVIPAFHQEQIQRLESSIPQYRFASLASSLHDNGARGGGFQSIPMTNTSTIRCSGNRNRHQNNLNPVLLNNLLLQQLNNTSSSSNNNMTTTFMRPLTHSHLHLNQQIQPMQSMVQSNKRIVSSNDQSNFHGLDSLAPQQQQKQQHLSNHLPNMSSNKLDELLRARMNYAKGLFQIRSKVLMNECLIQAGFSEQDLLSTNSTTFVGMSDKK